MAAWFVDTLIIYWLIQKQTIPVASDDQMDLPDKIPPLHNHRAQGSLLPNASSGPPLYTTFYRTIHSNKMVWTRVVLKNLKERNIDTWKLAI